MKPIHISLHQFAVIRICYCIVQSKHSLTIQASLHFQVRALDEAGDHFSATERRADEASRSVTTWLKCHYMQQHLGEEFVGM